MSDPVNLSSGLPETVIQPEPDAVLAELERPPWPFPSRATPGARRSSQVVADHPRFLDGWARLGELGRDPVERYADFRVGYHRGLDRLRQSGWRGSGYVRWDHPVEPRLPAGRSTGCEPSAAEIGETDEEERCDQFLHQLDPNWPPADR